MTGDRGGGDREPPAQTADDWSDAVAASPNESTLWGRVVVDELHRAGVDAVCLAPGSRSTPLTMAFADHPGVRVFSHLDERSAAFFALGRAKRTGRPTPVVTTSGTATANLHPAVMEANQARVPMLVLTADRPRELQHSGANQTVDQERLYGDAVRHYRSLPDPAFDATKLRAVRTAVSRAVHTASDGTTPGPVHLNCPFRKPLEPTPTDVPDGWTESMPLAARGRPDGSPFVTVTGGRPELGAADRGRLVEAIEAADSGIVVCGPADRPTPARDAMRGLALSTGFPVLADPLSGLRWGSHVDASGVTVCGGYDGYVGALEEYPDLVLRFGASPTSKPLRKYLAEAGERGARQFLVDPAGQWREAEFTATDLVVAAETPLAAALSGRVDREAGAFEHRLASLEREYWDRVADDARFVEGDVLADVATLAPDPSTLFVSNSMPVRDLDRFARPHEADLTVLGNRGASGIDGIASTALGAGSATDGDEPLVLVTGDLAYYHDSNGLLAVARSGVDATIVLVNNDGGGIFHLLPVESFDPPFTEQFTTPHGLDFEPTADLYGLEFARTDDRETFRELFAESVESGGTQVLEIVFDQATNHRERDALQTRVHEWVRQRGSSQKG